MSLTRDELLTLVMRALAGDERQDEVAHRIAERLRPRLPALDTNSIFNLRPEKLAALARDRRYWYRENGQIVHIWDMTDEHLRNTLAKLRRGDVSASNALGYYRRCCFPLLLMEAKWRGLALWEQGFGCPVCSTTVYNTKPAYCSEDCKNRRKCKYDNDGDGNCARHPQGCP